MGVGTGIEWTDATWNPVTGCSKVSSGCDNCYAATLANRLLGDHYRRRLPVVQTPENKRDPFAVRLWPERLSEPSRWSSPRQVFVNSMSDLFHTDVPEGYLRTVFEVMLTETRHTYQILTKRPARALRFYRHNRDLFPAGRIPRHIWLGTSVEDQSVTFRIHQLVQVPAETRFLSCEPLLGPIRLSLKGIHWVIAGGESGVVHRPIKMEWVRTIRDKCRSSRVPFFFKQVGGRTPKANGRLLDGETWSEYPVTGAT